MKKFTTIIFAILAFATASFAQPTYPVYTEEGKIPEDVAAKFDADIDWLTIGEMTRNGTFPLTIEDLKRIISTNKGKRLKPADGKINVIAHLPVTNQYFEEFKKFSKEEAIEYFRVTASYYPLMAVGLITADTVVSGGMKTDFNLGTTAFIGNQYMVAALIKFSGTDGKDIRNKLYSFKLATGEYKSKTYKKWFQTYLKEVGVKKAKEIVSNELTAFLAVVDPSNKEQNDWLTVLRVLNTSYAEL